MNVIELLRPDTWAFQWNIILLRLLLKLMDCCLLFDADDTVLFQLVVGMSRQGQWLAGEGAEVSAS
jgi:hypothetical protein